VAVVTSEIQRFAQKHKGRIHPHENVEAIQLLDNMGIVRRLQREQHGYSAQTAEGTTF